MSLYLAELRRVLRSLTYLAAVAVLVLFACSQSLLPPEELVAEPQPGQSYGARPGGDPERIMPEALAALEAEYALNRYATYPTGFYREVRLRDGDRERMGELIERMRAAGWEAFQALMREADALLGGGTNYAVPEENFGYEPLTYADAMGEYALIRDIDRFSGAHARLFCDYMGVMLALLSAFPAAELFMCDRRGVCPAVYARRASSWQLVLARYAALVTAMLLPVLIMGAALTGCAALDYGPGAIDGLAYFKYALGWLLPTIMLSTGVGMLPTALTGLPLGAAAMLIWWYAEVMKSALVGSYAALLAPRHNALGETAVFLQGLPALVRGRAAALLLGLMLAALTALAVQWRRRGDVYGRVRRSRAA